ncbi:hypothetical protein DPX16_18934 [Anabarilius grahami]|uniref:Uncharacterized protein n=1 Tax=Anabarilius grahami TaxID=495550 RepID=A0A3N0YLQ8_ANAGA|nr:hypothetical protein DPX16_18934 [Anabarilius grahami]
MAAATTSKVYDSEGALIYDYGWKKRSTAEARTREKQDQMSSQAGPGENQRAQSRVKSSSKQYPEGEPDPQGRIAYHVGHQGELSWSRSEQAKDGCLNNSRERKGSQAESIRGSSP